MAPPSGTYETFTAIGQREDLTDMIYDISPTDTPFLSGISSVTAEATLHEWQTDALASASGTNIVEEGLDAATDTAVETVRLTNDCQISDKVPRVSGTLNAVRKAGRGDELAYQIAKRAKELKRDMETSLLQSVVKTAGSSGTARALGGVPTWLTSNLDEASDATTSTGLGANARSDGTARDFTEAQFNNVIKQCWDEGGDPDCLMVGSHNKQVASGFTGNATRFKGAEDHKLVQSIDIIDTDFGEVQVLPNRFQPAAMAFVFQKDLWATGYLRPFQLHDLAKTGDSERRQLLVEFTMESRNEKGSGAVMDLNVS